MNIKSGLSRIPVLLMITALTACGGDSDGGGGGGPTSYTYNSTTSRGDLVNYTITGSNASIEWNVTNDVGAISFTWNTTATCGAHDATYGCRHMGNQRGTGYFQYINVATWQGCGAGLDTIGRRTGIGE